MKVCYEALLARQPSASGRLVVRFVLEERDGRGKITQASTEPQQRDGGTEELVDPLTEQCILNALSETTFPAPQGGPVAVSYPFMLTPGRPSDDGGGR